MPLVLSDRQQRLLAFALVGLVAVVFAWLSTTPQRIALINWDNAAYIAGIASGRYTWSELPWSSHLGIGHEYLLGVALARGFGGTVIDGFRLTNALFFAAACITLYDLCLRIARSGIVAASLVALWAAAWVNFHYHLILEDNILFLAPAAAVLRLCVLHVDRWQPRYSLLCGALSLVAFFGSYQALPYLGTAVWAALISPGRPLRQRVRDIALVFVAFGATLVGWMVVVWAVSKLTWRQLAHQVMLGPVPNFLPRSPRALLAYIFDGHSLFEVLGNGVIWNLSFHAYWQPGPPPVSPWLVGLAATVLLVVLFAGTTWWGLRQRSLAPHLLSATLLLLCFVTSLHRDLVEYTALKRYDCAPLILTMLAAFALYGLRRRLELPRLGQRRLLAAAWVGGTALLTVTQLWLGVRWSAQTRAKFVSPQGWNQLPHPEVMWYGRDGKSWFDYFRQLAHEHREACLVVLSYGELVEGSWNFDITGALWSELPNHLAVASEAMVQRLRIDRQRYAPKWVRAQAAQIPACAWVSADAKELLAHELPVRDVSQRAGAPPP